MEKEKENVGRCSGEKLQIDYKVKRKERNKKKNKQLTTSFNQLTSNLSFLAVYRR